MRREKPPPATALERHPTPHRRTDARHPQLQASQRQALLRLGPNGHQPDITRSSPRNNTTRSNHRHQQRRPNHIPPLPNKQNARNLRRRPLRPPTPPTRKTSLQPPNTTTTSPTHRKIREPSPLHLQKTLTPAQRGHKAHANQQNTTTRHPHTRPQKRSDIVLSRVAVPGWMTLAIVSVAAIVLPAAAAFHEGEFSKFNEAPRR